MRSPHPRSHSTPRSLLRAVVAIAAVASLAGALACTGDAQADTTHTAAASPVRVAAAARDTSRAVIRAGGVTEPRATTDLAFQVPGRVVSIAADEGTRVTRGEMIAALDPTEYRLAYERADLAWARQASELRRWQALLASGSVSANDFDKLENEAKQAGVQRALAEKRHADTRLLAPFSGTIARKMVEVGATVGTGTTVVTLADLSEVEVRVGVSEADVAAVRVGQPASVELSALAAPLAGRVTHVGVIADPASRTYAIKVALPNPDNSLRGGMIATVLLPTARARSMVTVPATAVVRDPDGATNVFVYAEGERRVHARRVEIGDALGADVDIVRGLAVGDKVVVAGQQRLRDGAAVTIVGGR